MNQSRPTPILCLGGFDPSGCAGLLADARMLLSLGAHPWLLMLLDTSQSRLALSATEPRPVAWLQQQWAVLTAEGPPRAIKLGAVANQEQADWLAKRLQQFAGPVVLDPVLASSSGVDLASAAAIRTLAPMASLLTPNRHEAAELFDIDPDNPRWTPACAAPLLVTGADHAADQDLAHITHRLLTADGQHDFTVARQPGRYRGTGCLLASALTVALANGQALVPACDFALQTVAQWIAAARRFDDGVHLPAEPR